MGAVVQMAGQIMGGNATAAADQERALELRQQSRMVQTQAQEQQAVRQNELQKTVGAINALTASRGLSTGSPSAQAYGGGVKKAAYLDTSTIGANAAIQSGMLRESADAAVLAGQNAQMNSWFSALGTLDSSAAAFLAA